MRRFKNGKKRRIFEYRDRVSITHLGGATFLYSYPGRGGRVVRKVEFGRRRNRIRSFSISLFAILFIALSGLLSNTGNTGSISLERLEKMEEGFSPLDLEENSIRMRNHLIGFGEPGPEDPALKKAGPRFVEYTIKPGDTLSEIAARHRVPIEMITESSGIKSYSILRPGQKLIIPRRGGLVYKMKKGDCLAAVAQTYSVKLEDILAENPELESLDVIPGEEPIFLPDAKIPAPPPVWYRPGWGRLTGRFGIRRHPILKRRRMHYGIDIGMRYGWVRAARSGHVVFAGRLGSYGRTIIIEHNGGYKTLYAHLSRTKVKKGKYVKARSRIAISGNTGLSTGPHLHFEIIRYGRAINPRKKIRF